MLIITFIEGPKTIDGLIRNLELGFEAALTPLPRVLQKGTEWKFKSPERLVIRFEDNPLGTAMQTFLDKDSETTDWDVFPFASEINFCQLSAHLD